jgi:hypothetical protein
MKRKEIDGDESNNMEHIRENCPTNFTQYFIIINTAAIYKQ